jgi:CheY-like chemotaxis protein
VPEQGTESILIVDDETVILSLTHAMLTRYGYNVIGAQSGGEALRLVASWPDLKIDMAIIDIVMPVMDGIELTRRLHELRPNLPVLYISAYAENEHLRPINTQGLPMIAKPFSSVTLIAKIRKMLDRESAESASSPEA